MKTILIASRPGFFARMQLRSPMFTMLREMGCKICVLWPNPWDACLQRELGNDVSLEPLYTQRPGGRLSLALEHYLQKLRMFSNLDRSSLIPPQTWRLRRLSYAARSSAWHQRAYLKTFSIGVRLLNRSSLARASLVKFEALIARTSFYRDIFEGLRPAVIVVGTGGYANWGEDAYLIREAQRAHIPVIYVVASWDNPSTKGLMGATPDYILVWTNEMKREFIELHSIDPARIHVTGTPMVDAYVAARGQDHRAQLITQYELDPNRSTILIGTMSPSTYPYNVNIIEMLAHASRQNRFAKPVQIIIRPHPINYRHSKIHPDIIRMRELAYQSPHIRISEPQIVSNGSMDLPWSETHEMIRLVSGADVMVNLFSTMQIEAALADTPIINVAFDSGVLQPCDHSLTEIPLYPHIARVIDTGGVRLARSEDELIEQINSYLVDRGIDRTGRQALVEQECGPTDGLSSLRIAQFIIAVAAGEARA